MHKELLLLGLLQGDAMTGYDLHRIVTAHGDLYSDLKKGNLYYLLERLAAEGHLTVVAEGNTRGRRGERLRYAITAQGCQHFIALLHQVLSTYEVAHLGVEVAIIFLERLPEADALHLLEQRRAAVLAKAEASHTAPGGRDSLLQQIAQDHMQSLMDAELAWIDRSLQRLRAAGRATTEYAEKNTTHGKGVSDDLPSLPR
jgi:DNA-binding PadR family transcriptional regulator